MRTLIIILASIALSAALALISHGHILFLGLPLVIGLPLAGLSSRRRSRRPTPRSWPG